MTRKTNARLAGFMFLFYIAAGITTMVLSDRAMSGKGTAAKLVSVAGHATDMRFIGLFWLATVTGANARDSAAAQALAAYFFREGPGVSAT